MDIVYKNFSAKISIFTTQIDKPIFLIAICYLAGWFKIDFE